MDLNDRVNKEQSIIYGMRRDEADKSNERREGVNFGQDDEWFNDCEEAQIEDKKREEENNREIEDEANREENNAEVFELDGTSCSFMESPEPKEKEQEWNEVLVGDRGRGKGVRNRGRGRGRGRERIERRGEALEISSTWDNLLKLQEKENSGDSTENMEEGKNEKEEGNEVEKNDEEEEMEKDEEGSKEAEKECVIVEETEKKNKEEEEKRRHNILLESLVPLYEIGNGKLSTLEKEEG